MTSGTVRSRLKALWQVPLAITAFSFIVYAYGAFVIEPKIVLWPWNLHLAQILSVVSTIAIIPLIFWDVGTTLYRWYTGRLDNWTVCAYVFSVFSQVSALGFSSLYWSGHFHFDIARAVYWLFVGFTVLTLVPAFLAGSKESRK